MPSKTETLASAIKKYVKELYDASDADELECLHDELEQIVEDLNDKIEEFEE